MTCLGHWPWTLVAGARGESEQVGGRKARRLLRLSQNPGNRVVQPLYIGYSLVGVEG